MQILKATRGIGLRVTEEAEDIGLDISEHGESMIVSHNQVRLEHSRSRGAARMHALRICLHSTWETALLLRHTYTCCGSLLDSPWLALDTHS